MWSDKRKCSDNRALSGAKPLYNSVNMENQSEAAGGGQSTNYFTDKTRFMRHKSS